ncbi:MAG TPA: MarR family transcriptional regulator [Steroidobacteraceae bacterium]|jgi:DNA-binding MarR family transcriptional regulator
MDTRLRNFGFLLKDVSRRYVLRFEQRAREIALTLPQCKVLARLENNEGVSQARLAELTEIEPMTMVRILDRMEADGLLERRPDPADRRARSLYLTARAKPLLEQIWRLSELTRAETFAGISRAERELFMSLLERMHSNVCALDERAAPSLEAAAPRQPDSKAGAAGRIRKIRTR